MAKKHIPLFWWSEIKFIFKKKENYGDLLSKYLVEKISGREVKFVHPKKQAWYKWNKQNYLAAGSIIHHATKDSVVWGSGIIDQKQIVAQADFRAVRGPLTRNYLKNIGYECPPIYGDPALLLSNYFNPTVKKEYKLGVIPHYHDFLKAQEIYRGDKNILVIDLMTLQVEEVTLQILSCKKTISSSLHGLIVSHAYEIPSVWVEFSNKIFGDGIKYADYLESVGIAKYTPLFLEKEDIPFDTEIYFKNKECLVNPVKLKELKKGLMESCPFV